MKELNIQYFHFRSELFPEYTAVVEVPSKEELLSFLNSLLSNAPRNEIELGIGIARCHPNDQFNKAIGRYIAEQRMEVQWFEFQSLVSVNDRHIYTFNCISGDDATIQFSSVPWSENVNLESVMVR